MADRYFILNPSGAVHEVSKEQAAELLRGVRGPGYRAATPEQVKQYMIPNPKFEKPIQDWREPIGERWDPEPEAIDVDAIMAEAGQMEKAPVEPKEKAPSKPKKKAPKKPPSEPKE